MAKPLQEPVTMRAVALLSTITALAACAGAPQAEEATGKQLFDRHCGECHAPGLGHPGTQRLGWNRGEQFAVLEQRNDLSAVYVETIVRRGFLEMPPFRPSEISPAELAAIGRYLARVPAP